MLQFHEFVSQFSKDYALGTAEWVKRESIFNHNLAQIEAQNEAFRNGESLWAAGVNHFADMTHEERNAFKGYKKTHSGAVNMAAPDHGPVSMKGLPANVDWRDQNMVTPPKNQGSCGSCWAHAAIETIESHAAITLGVPLMELAPQQFVDCIRNPNQCGGTGGCEGATAELGFEFGQQGVTLNENYKYTGRDNSCHAANAAVYTSGYHKLPQNNATALMEAVANVGPVAISVAAATWSFYTHGVFDGIGGRGCDVEVDHAVQLVGYGTDGATGKDYWLVRNSWGPTWGEKGYIRIQRNPGNEPCAVDKKPLDGVCGKSGDCVCTDVNYCGTCAILSDSSYPIGVKLG